MYLGDTAGEGCRRWLSLESGAQARLLGGALGLSGPLVPVKVDDP